MTSMLGRLRPCATQLFTYFRRASHLTFLPRASALHAMIACFRATLLTSMLGRLRPCATQLFTYFRRASHLTFLPRASALHAMVACFRATLSASDILAAWAGINAAPLASTMAIMHVNRVAAKRDI